MNNITIAEERKKELEALTKFGLMLLYTIVYQVYYNAQEKTEGKKRVAYMTLTDGYTHVALFKHQGQDLIKQALEHERYEVGYEDYNYFNPDDKLQRPEGLDIEMKLQSVTFHHIFIKGDYIDTIFGQFKSERQIRFLTKPKKEAKNGK